MIKYTEASIQSWLADHYGRSDIKYMIPNVFLFRHDWESDFIVIRKKSGYCLEFEIKVSRSDMKADSKKKIKHQILREGTRPPNPGGYVYDPEIGEWVLEAQDAPVPVKFRPNQFYYVVPSGLISVDEVPKYAGLIYVDDQRIKTVKRAPFLHKERLDIEKKLCSKFYYYWLALKVKVQSLNNENKYLKTKLDEYTSQSVKSQGSSANKTS